MSIRTERVAGEIQKALSEIFREEFSHLYEGLLTVTIVRVSPDLRHAKIYLSIISKNDSKELMLQRIRKEAPHIRASLARELRLRHVPELMFYLDDTQEEVEHIERLFQEVHRRERNEHE
jgi:ribosome-binding factor A